MRGVTAGPTCSDARTALLRRRGLLMLATLPIIGMMADSWYWIVVLSMPVLVNVMAVARFRSDRLDQWSSRGILFIADASLVGLILLGVARERPELLAVFSALILLSVLVASRVKTLLGSVALLGLLAAVGVPGHVSVVAADALYLPLLFAAALHFGDLGQRLSRPARTIEAGRQERGELWALLEITDAITGRLDVGEVMHSVVKNVGELAGSPSCSILLVDRASPGCFVVASRGHPEADMMQLDLDKYPEVQHVLENRCPLIVDDVAGHPLIAPMREKILERGFRSMLVLPLLAGNEVVGVLLLKARQVGAFPPAVIHFCKVAAGVSANALKKALLYRDVKQAGDKLRRVLDASPDMIVATDNAGRVVEFNPGAERLTATAAADALGRPLTELLQAGPLEPSAEDDPVELTIQAADRAEAVVSLVSAPLSEIDGESEGHVWIGRDVTKLRQVEKSLAQAERLSSLGEVVAGVAHELNNPLSGVVGYAELLRAHAHDPAQIRDLQRIVQSALRCQKIVFNLLSFARKHDAEMKYQCINECVEKVLDLKSYQLRSARIQPVLELDPDLPRTCFDFHQIDQVILNLLNNAEQAIRSEQREGTITLRTGVDADLVFIEIEDDGPGVPDSARERIFDPFFTTKDIGEGTGLGLSVSYGIVHKHGGRIELREGRSGACFRISLPIVEGQEAEARPEPDEIGTANPLRGRRILIAEDEPMVLELLVQFLSDEGAQVTPAQDGAEALERLAEAAFDLVITDLRMPNLSGQELFETVVAERPEMIDRFVFATGDLAGQDTLAFLEGKSNRIIAKPLELVTVRRVLSQAIDSAGS